MTRKRCEIWDRYRYPFMDILTRIVVILIYIIFKEMYFEESIHETNIIVRTIEYLHIYGIYRMDHPRENISTCCFAIGLC